MKSFLVVGLLALSSVAVAEDKDYFLDVNLASKHFCEATCPTVNNERNWGVGLTVDFKNNWEVKVGAYKNSYSEDSVYALANRYWDFSSSNGDWIIRPGIAVGLVYGYQGTAGEMKDLAFANDKIQLGFLPNVVIGYRRLRTVVGWVGNVCTLQAQWQLK